MFGAAPHNPVVLVTHGRGGHIGDTHALCRRLAARGLTAIGVEQRNHGRRLVSREANDHTPRHATDMYGLIVGTATDLSLLLDFLPAALGLSVDKVGVTGVSLGGHVTLMALGLDTRFTAGAAFLASGDYRQLMTARHQREEFRDLPWEAFYPRTLAQTVERFDPVHRPQAFADRPLLLLNGADDTLVPLDGNENLRRAVGSLSRAPECLQQNLYPGLGHEVNESMESDAVNWLERWLR